ncbi:TetR/AcrR family transcriptional regulator [Mycolicibacterium goodii]|uniref:TetR/AcrR family transcriptional regulator n=1 Tax=Mycolicibacterium goodii TaxID=134601 RepID=UPI000C267CAD|nr:TetR/AcrR family transcriptional regulator [Mycolicibacterium goodii]MBU8809285.1 TetR/AcrR family transcriptional regulator [Mycolicibacterium goodii]PJK18792.1 TetR family transcriptional regulator [Mycolicibacterium goodii]
MRQTRTARSRPGRPAGGDSVDTRQRVIDAACRCFAQYGYGPATNNQIAEMAGVTAGSVYYHFGTKNKLFEAVCDDVYGKILTRSAQAVSGPQSVVGLLRAVLTESMRINHESPELAGFVATAPIDARRHPELTGTFATQAARMIDALTQAVRMGQEAGHIPAELDPVRIAHLVSAIVDGFALAAASADPDDMDGMNELFQSLLLGTGSAPGTDEAGKDTAERSPSRRH